MILPPAFDARRASQHWDARWEREKAFYSSPGSGKRPYTVVLPPPNITGPLHLGHALNVMGQDPLVRRARMQGKEACWVPGIDHASIATEAKVVARLATRGLNKPSLGREAFLREAWQWKEEFGPLIFRQFRALGASLDWSKALFTLDPQHAENVKKAFLRLYKEGYIYRSHRMIHWDPQGQTALSDEEVDYRQVEGKLYYIRYPLVDRQESVVVATTRPETLLGDTALCVHPEDERYFAFHGARAWVPLVDRAVPFIVDDYVDPSLGTGCLKVTPAHDVNDYALGERHGLPRIELFEPDGRLHPRAGRYVGEDRAVAREKIVDDLAACGALVRVVPYTHSVGFSERTGAVVEPRCSTQWFVKMKALAAPALASVRKGEVRFFPERFKAIYYAWLEGIKDWCISRQLWWGHRIPAYYLPKGEVIVAASREEALAQARRMPAYAELSEEALVQDEDVLDTWFSSWLWPFSVCGGGHEADQVRLSSFYPTEDLVTGPDIIFFWVARMIMAGHYFTGQVPFKQVCFTGIVRDAQRRKMSKQLGNSPDLLKLIDRYGADGLRAGMLFCAPAGNDLLFSEKLCQQGEQFVHKIWQALRLVKGWETLEKAPCPTAQVACRWLAHRLEQVATELDDHFEHYRLSQALMLLYKFFWEEYCAHYLEMIKPASGQPISAAVREETVGFFGQIIKMLHPFMPYITEEVHAQLGHQELLATSSWPETKPYSQEVIRAADEAFKLITELRHQLGQAPSSREDVVLHLHSSEAPGWLGAYTPYLLRRTRIQAVQLHLAQEPMPQGQAFVLGGCTYLLSGLVGPSKQARQEELLKDYTYMQGFLASVERKLANEKFLQKAPPAVIAREQQKQQDAQQRLAALSALLKEGKED